MLVGDAFRRPITKFARFALASDTDVLNKSRRRYTNSLRIQLTDSRLGLPAKLCAMAAAAEHPMQLSHRRRQSWCHLVSRHLTRVVKYSVANAKR